jgi:hypothetical protein
MPTLVFDYTDLRPLIEHSQRAPEQRATYRHLCNPDYWIPGAEPNERGIVENGQIDKGKLEPSLILVKDRGAYLMSGGLPGLKTANRATNQVAYAHGCHPDTDPDYYDTAAALCGDDDFAVDFPLGAFVDPTGRTRAVHIELTDDVVTVRKVADAPVPPCPAHHSTQESP